MDKTKLVWRWIYNFCDLYFSFSVFDRIQYLQIDSLDIYSWKERLTMKIKFENGSILESIESNDCKRSKCAEEIVYYIKNPYRLIEDLYGENLHWYQKLWIKFIILARKWRQLWRK